MIQGIWIEFEEIDLDKKRTLNSISSWRFSTGTYSNNIYRPNYLYHLGVF